MPEKTEDKQSLASPTGKPRKKVVVEEVSSPEQTTEIKPELTPREKEQTEDYHVEPGLHEEPTKNNVSPPPISSPEPAIPQGSPSGPNPLIIIIPGVFLLGALLGGIIFYQNKVSGTAQNIEPTPTEATLETPAISPSPEPKKVDLTKYPISILNGSGIKGEAGKVQNLLESANFKVLGTGNAANYSYTETIIQVKGEVPKEFITQLETVLGKIYKVATKNQSLSDSSKDSVVIIVGSSKN